MEAGDMTDWTANQGRVGWRGSMGRWTLRSVGPLLAAIVGCWLTPVAMAAWSIQPTPTPTAGQEPANGLFNSVSCPSAGTCTAVGDSVDGSGYDALSEGWNGSAWSLQSPVNLPLPLTTILSGVSCANANACAAVGSALIFTIVPIVELWNGSQWTGAFAGPPTQQGAAAASLSGVSCSAAQECDAVGYTFVLGQSGSPSGLVPLSELWTGGPWGAAPLPTPTGALESSLSGVSCSTSSCTAVGSYTNSSDVMQPLVETTGASAVNLASVPTPAKAVSSVFFAVSCSASNACTATGASINAGGIISPLAERWNGTAWSIETTPTATGTTGGALLGVSCPAASACTATGVSFTSAGAAQPLIESWNGAIWSTQTAAVATGATPVALTSVSCTAASACTAVGGSLPSSAPDLPLTLAESTGGSPSAAPAIAGSASVARATASESRTLARRLPFPAGPLLAVAAASHGRVSKHALASVLKAKLATARSG
jgi:hypothetical protein